MFPSRCCRPTRQLNGTKPLCGRQLQKEHTKKRRGVLTQSSNHSARTKPLWSRKSRLVMTLASTKEDDRQNSRFTVGLCPITVGRACWIQRRTVLEMFRVRIPAGAAEECSPPESTLCADSYSVCVPPPVLPQWHVKDPGYSAKSAGGRLHLNTHTPLTQRSRCGLTMSLSRQSVGTYQETIAHTQLFREHSVTVVSAR